MRALEIPEDVIDEVANALDIALKLAIEKAPELADRIGGAYMRFDEAIKDAQATEP